MSKGNIALGTKAWAERLNAAYDRVTATWQSSVENIIALGKELLAAREALPKGVYTNMIYNELKFSASTATRVIKIAESQKIFSHAKILPPHWATLYPLSLLDDETFDRAVEAGVIRPDMERSEVPVRSRNLSVGERPRGRPRKSSPQTIEGTATEVRPTPALPMPEPPQPPKPAPPPVAPQRIEQSPAYLQANAERQKLQRDVARLQAENASCARVRPSRRLKCSASAQAPP